MPPSNIGHTRSNGRQARGGGAQWWSACRVRRRHWWLIRVEPKARSGGPFPSGLGPTRSMKHGILTSGTGGQWWAVRRRVWLLGFFLELRRRWGMAPRLLRPWFFSRWWLQRLLFLDDRSDEVGAWGHITVVSGLGRARRTGANEVELASKVPFIELRLGAGTRGFGWLSMCT
jgi:hypothetical protein